jgi:hypothetical protein
VRREAQSDAPSSLRLCGASFVFLAEAEAGFRHPYPQDRSVKTAAVAAGIAANGRTSKTGCRSREIVQAGASPASGLLRADRVDDVGARLRANSCFHDLSASVSAEDYDFSPQKRSVRREAQADAPSSLRSLRLCGASFVFLADAEAGFRHPYPQDRSVKTAAAAAGIAADGRTSKTGCRGREIVQAGASPASGLLRADRVDDVGARLRANSCFLDLSASASAEDCHFSPQRCGVRREAQSDAPSSLRSLRLCGASFVFLAEAEAGFRHPYPQDRSVKTAAVAAGIAADGRTSKTGCRSREIVQAGASPASGLLRADRVDDVGARLRANSCAEVPGARTLFSAFSAANLLFC